MGGASDPSRIAGRTVRMMVDRLYHDLTEDKTPKGAPLHEVLT